MCVWELKAEIQIQPSPSCTHTQTDIDRPQTSHKPCEGITFHARNYCQGGKESNLSPSALQAETLPDIAVKHTRQLVSVRVCVWEFHLLYKLLDSSERQKENRELTSKGKAVLQLLWMPVWLLYVTPPSAESSRCTHRRGRFTAGWLLRNEPQEAFRRRARGISTIINNPVFRGEKVSTFFKKSCLCGALQQAQCFYTSKHF